MYAGWIVDSWQTRGRSSTRPTLHLGACSARSPRAVSAQAEAPGRESPWQPPFAAPAFPGVRPRRPLRSPFDLLRRAANRCFEPGDGNHLSSFHLGPKQKKELRGGGEETTIHRPN